MEIVFCFSPIERMFLCGPQLFDQVFIILPLTNNPPVGPHWSVNWKLSVQEK